MVSLLTLTENANGNSISMRKAVFDILGLIYNFSMLNNLILPCVFERSCYRYCRKCVN
ncbi:hypothetical protein BCN_1812 [Bacillus cereus NC7401]|nr:hypothetical protein BCN_1812 [Bacillus cereus NC7401]